MAKRGVILPKEGNKVPGCDGAVMVAAVVVRHVVEHPGRWVLSSVDWPGCDLEINVRTKTPDLPFLGRAVPSQFKALP